jgi:hypothetical protein
MGITEPDNPLLAVFHLYTEGVLLDNGRQHERGINTQAKF